ncbi:MAG: UbiA family prenyltransferase [Candidatus Aminicenantes bacterium]|nr:UbiA family prenyltransferase [Candidatus Aminicenantes bacterium]
MNPYLEALRLERWPRSTAIFLGSATCLFFEIKENAFVPPHWPILGKIILAFLLTWGISTVNYIINEIADAPFDRHHPLKKMRPLVSGRIEKTTFILLGLFLALFCFTFSFLFFSWLFTVSLLSLLLAGFVYNVTPLRTKDIPFLDSISESANNPIRFLIGWYALNPGSFPPIGLLLAWWAFGNFLMVAKRLSELRWLKDKAALYRQSLQKYSTFSLLTGMAVSMIVFFAGYLWFCWQYNLRSWFFYTIPLLLYFLLFFWKTLKEKAVMEEPERLFRRPLFAFYTVGLIILFLISLLRLK